MHEATARQWAYGVWPQRDPAAIRDKIEPGFTDPDGGYLVGDLDDAGIDVGVVMMLDHALGFRQEPGIPLEALLDHYAGLRERHGSRLRVFASVDPRRPDAVNLLRRAVQVNGLTGLKLYPPNGYYPGDEACAPLLTAADDLGVPVLVHTAMIGYPLQGFYANPLYLAAVQKAHPSLTLIFGHSGYPLWGEEAALTAAGHENSYLEISQWDRLLTTDEERLIRTLGRFRDVVGPHRILFASDHVSGPRFSGRRSRLPALVEFLKNLPATAARYGVSFTAAETALIMGGNAARVLGLAPAADHAAGSV